jgi:hypothetical protein
MSRPHVVCVDVTPRAFDQLYDEPALLCKVVTNDVVLMSYDAAALGDDGVNAKGVSVFTVFTGTSSDLRFGFFYGDVSHVDESLNAALARCIHTQTDRRLTTREDRWGDLDVPFCNLLGGSATERPADEAVHAGATLLPAIKCGAGKVLDYVREDGQTVAVVVDTGVLPQHVGAAVDRAIRDGTCVAMHCRVDVHPCDKTSVFWLALETLRVWTWRKTPAALPELTAQKPPTTAPAETVKLLKKVQNVETPEVIEYRFYRHEPPTTRFETVVTPWAEPPHRNEQTGVTMRAQQSAKWIEADWKCSTATTEYTWTHPVTLDVFEEQHTVESWQHNDYGPTTFSRCDMKSAVLKIDHENNVFARNRFYPVRSHSRGPDALFRASGSSVHLTRTQVRARITAAENALYKTAGFTCALVDDELRFCKGGAMPTTEQWSHETYEAGSTFARDEMPAALRCLAAAQVVTERAQNMFWQKDKKAKTGTRF